MDGEDTTALTLEALDEAPHHEGVRLSGGFPPVPQDVLLVVLWQTLVWIVVLWCLKGDRARFEGKSNPELAPLGGYEGNHRYVSLPEDTNRGIGILHFHP